MPNNPAKVTTAEEFLEDIREMLIGKVEIGELLEGLYLRASVKQQIQMMGALDEAHEAERLLEAFAVARSHLAQHPEPQSDPIPPRRSSRRQ
jgi:hypothetical protein